MWRLNIHIREVRQSKYLSCFVTLNCHFFNNTMKYHSQLNAKKIPNDAHFSTCDMFRQELIYWFRQGQELGLSFSNQLIYLGLLCTACTEVFSFFVDNFVWDSEQFYYGMPDCLLGSQATASCLHLSGIKSALVFRILKKIYYLVEWCHTTKHI